MGDVRGAAVTAREKARRRRVLLDADRDARDRRVEQAAAAVFLAQLDQARYEAGLAAADGAIAAGLSDLVKEGLTVEQVAELVEVPPARVRRLLKPAPAATSAGPAASVSP